MIRVSGVKVGVLDDYETIKSKCIKKANIKPSSVKYFKIIKKSLDARDKSNIFYLITADVSDKNEKSLEKVYQKVKNKANILVVGAGPAGLFCALDLLRYGLNVTLIERGKSVEERKSSVSKFETERVLDEESNIQFGEGGAGAFSDGKLYTQIGGELSKEVIDDFVLFGAPEEISYLNKPHIGSDNLPKVVKNIRNEIIRLGGKVMFSTKLTDFSIKNNKIVSVTFGNKTETFDDVVLAVGHSARDIYDLCFKKGVQMESKDFAVGVRIEHLRKDINVSQYGEKYANLTQMPTADYKLTSNFNGRGVFTFCMCPGGYVMPSSSEKETVVVNGMSNYLRNAENSNSALIVQTKKSDFGENLFDGVNFQRSLEKKAFLMGGEDYSAPCSMIGDFLKNTTSNEFGKVKPSYSLGVKKCNLNNLLPSFISDGIKFAITDMSKRLKGFDSYDGLLTGVETRTSSPIRILRNENLTSVSVENLYPCGEGCGYAGGITSAGADGKKIAKKIAEKYGK